MLEVAQKVVDDWMKIQVGFLNWEIHRNGEGSHTDIVYWESKTAVDAAQKEMANLSNAGEWIACYKEGSIRNQPLHFLTNFNG